MLEVSNIDTHYGKIQALWAVSLKIDEKEIVALVGANGAGKTTLLNTITGLLRPSAGRVEFLGKSIYGLQSHTIVEMGISHIPEGRKLFPDMSVRENLEMGAYTKRVWQHRQDNLEKVYQLFPILKARKGEQANQAVVISADKNVRYEEVISVMDLLQQQNIQKVGLLTKLKAE